MLYYGINLRTPAAYSRAQVQAAIDLAAWDCRWKTVEKLVAFRDANF